MMICNEVDLRRPPKDLLDRLPRLDKAFALGAALRECTEPDFIAAAISSGNVVAAQMLLSRPHTRADRCRCSHHVVYLVDKEGSEQVSRVAVEQSSEWLIPAIAVDPDVIFRRIPVSAVCQLLLMATLQLHLKGLSDTICVEQEMGDLDQAPDGTRQRSFSNVSDIQLTETLHRADVVRPLVLHVRRAIRSLVDALTNQDSGQVDVPVLRRDLRRILQVFLTELSEPLSGRRVAARKALDLVLPAEAPLSSTSQLAWLHMVSCEPTFIQCLSGHLLRWIRKATLSETDLNVAIEYLSVLSDASRPINASDEAAFGLDTLLLHLLSTRPALSEELYGVRCLHLTTQVVELLERAAHLAKRCIIDIEPFDHLR